MQSSSWIRSHVEHCTNIGFTFYTSVFGPSSQEQRSFRSLLGSRCAGDYNEVPCKAVSPQGVDGTRRPSQHIGHCPSRHDPQPKSQSTASWRALREGTFTDDCYPSTGRVLQNTAPAGVEAANRNQPSAKRAYRSGPSPVDALDLLD